MKICIAGGGYNAAYVVSLFKDSKDTIVIINGDEKVCKYIADVTNLPVECNNPTKVFAFEEAGVHNFDLIVALCEEDSDNYIICQMAKKIFGFSRAICTVSDPYNVKLFKELGIDSPISDTVLLTQTIKNESSIESMVKSLSFENDNIVITEIIIKDEYVIANKEIKDIGFPKIGTIGCVYRKPHIVIPSGDTKILKGDKLLIISSPNDQEDIINFVRRK